MNTLVLISAGAIAVIRAVNSGPNHDCQPVTTDQIPHR